MQYLNLIQSLLNCPQGQEPAILQANQELLDEGLVVTMVAVAAKMSEEGEENKARWLLNLAEKLAEMLGLSGEESDEPATPTATNHAPEVYDTFARELLQAEYDSNSDAKLIHRLFADNLDKLNENFAPILLKVAADIIAAKPEETETMVGLIENLCIDIWQFPLGSIANNIEIVIAGSKFVLQHRQENTEGWAITQNNLGTAYINRIHDDRAENLEKAIAAYNAALTVRTEIAFPVEWAGTQINLGYAYHDRIKGEKRENMDMAIAAYNGATRVYTETAFPHEWARTQTYLGAAYLKRNRIKGDKGENLEQAIAAYNAALKVITETAFPYEWAMTQYNLGNAYLNRIKGDKGENLELAIAAYKAALKVRTETAFPYQWATTQHNLGNAYSDRIQGDKGENMERAIAAYNAVLKVKTEAAFPYEWAMTQNNLGNAYSNRIKGDKKENMERAIAACNAALRVRTETAFLTEWAETQNNLGNAYLYRIKGDKKENMERAIAAYNAALKVRTETAFPYEWAMTQHNLGIAYHDRIKGDKEENMNMAIAAYNAALRVTTETTFPVEWAETQNNLGNTYSNRIKGDKEENMERAIAACNAALRVRTETAFPVEWAETQNNLGNAYSDRIKGDKRENLETAIAAYRLALTVTTPKALPQDCLRTARNLGDLGFKQGDWQLAIEGYEQAIQAVEQTRNWISDETRRQEVLQESILIFENAIQAYINNDQLEKALETVERFRCKRLVDLMATKDLYADGNLPPEVAELVREYEAKQQQIDLLRSQLQSGGDGDDKAKAPSYRTRDEWEGINEKIDKLTVEKQQIWKQLRRLDPLLAEGKEVPPLDLGKMRGLLGEDGEVALLSFYTTRSDTLIFILRQDGIQLHTCQGQGLEELQRWLYDNWFRPYAEIDYLAGFLAAAELLGCPVEELQSVSIESKQVIGLLADGSRQSIDKSQFQQLRKRKKQQLMADWQNRMEEILAALAKRLQLEELVEKLSGAKELILVPHLYLHQIPLAALPVGEPDKGEYWGAKFSIRTIASSQVLDFCSQRQQPKEKPTYGIVENPTEDLDFSPIECELVAKLYDVEPHNHLKNAAATKEKYRQLLREAKIQGLLSSHHAKSNLTEPLDSALRLADGRVTLGELLSPSWRLPDLKDLFLSCCETGLGDSNLTDDIFTLAAGFLCAGAINVVSSLWSVNDLATAILSYFYHKNRLDKLNRPQALWQAQMQLKNLTEEEALANLNDAEAVLEELEEGCQEYELWEKKADFWNLVLESVVKTKEQLGEVEKPFDRPYYWSGFLCQGLR